MDIHDLFGKLSVGQSNNLSKALANYFTFLQFDGVPKSELESFREVLPAQVIGVDNNVPTVKAVAKSLIHLPKLMLKHQAGYNLLLDSGLRAVEAERLITEFDASKVVAVNGFYRYSTGWARGNKNTFYAYFTEPTYQLLCETTGSKLSNGDLSNIARKHGLLAVKYLRKFAFDTMISEEVSMPESVADYIEGRTAKKVGARHYTQLTKQADGWYGRYASYLSMIRNTLVHQFFCAHCGGILTDKDPAPFCRYCATPAEQAEQKLLPNVST